MHVSGPARECAFAALLLGMLMSQLDGNVVVAALPVIGTELAAPAAVAGVTAAYLLTVTVSTPVHGRLGDLIGRRAVFAGSMLAFAVGSVLCAVAPSMAGLVAARAVQGIGGSGLVVSAVTALGEMFDHGERLRRQVWVTAVFAVSALAGPPVGAVLAAGPGWRWAFLVNLPLCAVGLVLGVRGLPGRPLTAGPRGFDVAGTVLVVLGGTAVVLLGSVGGPATGPLLVVAVAAGLLFVRVQRRAAVPLVPPKLLAERGMAGTILVTGLSGVALFGGFTFVPLAVTAGTGLAPATAGALLVALTAGQVAVGLVFAGAARRWSRMVPWGRLGLAMGAAGYAVLAALPVLPAGPGPAVAGMALVGAAVGLCLQAYTLLGQALAPADAFGAAMATLTFARQLGGSLGAAGLGWLVLAVGERTGPGVAPAAAAAVLVVALLLAPGRGDEPLATASPRAPATPPRRTLRRPPR